MKAAATSPGETGLAVRSSCRVARPGRANAGGAPIAAGKASKLTAQRAKTTRPRLRCMLPSDRRGIPTIRLLQTTVKASCAVRASELRSYSASQDPVFLKDPHRRAQPRSPALPRGSRRPLGTIGRASEGLPARSAQAPCRGAGGRARGLRLGRRALKFSRGRKGFCDVVAVEGSAEAHERGALGGHERMFAYAG